MEKALPVAKNKSCIERFVFRSWDWFATSETMACPNSPRAQSVFRTPSLVYSFVGTRYVYWSSALSV
jgi:hypothetical protein